MFGMAESPSSVINDIPKPVGQPLVDDSEDLELGREPGDETNAKTLAAEYLGAGSRITCTLLHVKYGTFKGEAAGLIVFLAKFLFLSKDSRTKRATIKVKFSQDDPGKPTRLPRILHHFPQQMQSTTVTPVSIHDTTHFKLNLNPPAPMNFVGIDGARSNEKSFTRTYHSTITSSVVPHSYTRKGLQCLNTVIWSISENEAQQSGVHPTFPAAIIVQLPEGDTVDPEFYAQFELKARQACEIRQLFSSFVQTFGDDRDVSVRFDKRVDFQADGLPDCLDDINLEDLLKPPAI